jgi:energy-coupling factor transporter ATP-binding protein EcfA2
MQRGSSIGSGSTSSGPGGSGSGGGGVGDPAAAAALRDLAARLNEVYDYYVRKAPRRALGMAKHALDVFAEAAREDGQPVRPDAMNLALLRKSYEDMAAGLNKIVQDLRMAGGFVEGPDGPAAAAGVDATELRARVWHIRLFMGQLFSAAAALLGCVVRRGNPSTALELDEDSAKYPFLNTGEAMVTKLPPTAKLIYFFLGQAFAHGLRREADMVYQQRFIRGTPTHAWMPLYNMHDFIHAMAPKEVHTEIWHLLHGEGSRVYNVEKYLIACKDSEFPRIVRQRRYHSFRNGVYDVNEDRFMPYGSDALTDDVVACNLHTSSVEPGWFDEPALLRDPMLIPTPQLDRIFEDQGFDLRGEVYPWILAWVLGRPLYDMGVIEKHHRNGVLLLGHAGSGKSTIAKLVQRYYADNDTGQLNSECEPKYALANLVGKYVWFCTEVKKNFQLDIAMMQLMLEGRTRIAIQKKNVTAWEEEWTTPGLMAGNEIPSKWIDGGAGNSLVRRMLIVEFPNKPKRQDPQLEARILAELPAIMVKANRMYRLLAARVGPDGDIDQFLPPYFRDTLARFQSKTQPFVYMLNNHPDLLRDPNGRMHLVELKGLFSQWCRVNGYKASSMDDDEILRQVKSQNLTTKQVKTATRGLQQGWYIHGLTTRGAAEGSANNDRLSFLDDGDEDDMRRTNAEELRAAGILPPREAAPPPAASAAGAAAGAAGAAPAPIFRGPRGPPPSPAASVAARSARGGDSGSEATHAAMGPPPARARRAAAAAPAAAPAASQDDEDWGYPEGGYADEDFGDV